MSQPATLSDMKIRRVFSSDLTLAQVERLTQLAKNNHRSVAAEVTIAILERLEREAPGPVPEPQSLKV
jgi:hypothetical protein